MATEAGTPAAPDPVEKGFRHGAANGQETTSLPTPSPERKESETEVMPGINETPITDINSSSDTSLSPILVTPVLNSSTEPPSPPRTDVRRRLIHDFTSSVTRGRVYSLDTGRDLLTSLDTDVRFHSSVASKQSVDDLTPRKQNGSGTRAPRLNHKDDNDDLSLGSHSSDGESSYFAKNLPSPRSGRRFSYDAGSISSAPARAGFYNGSASSLKVESDASLSFSDDDDDSVTDEEDRRHSATLLCSYWSWGNASNSLENA
jgi:hypothetical protein